MAPSSLLVRAAWVCPLTGPPLADGWVAIADDRVIGIGTGTPPPTSRVLDLGNVVILPGLVNAHTHLELSWMRGRVPPSGDFLRWVGQLMALRRGFERADDPEAMTPLANAVDEMRATGTVAVGDTSNALVSPPVLTGREMPAVVFHEHMGFRVTDGSAVLAGGADRRQALSSDGVRVVPAAHAPFSVSAELFCAIRDDVRRDPQRLTSVHVGESAAEVQLLADGTGPWRDRLQALGVWREDWTPPGRGPADYLCDLGVIDHGTLAVHGVQLSDAELERLAAVGATLVTCPRSNTWVGVGAPPLERFFASGVRVAVGTDSLASAPDLNVFAELAEMRRLAPALPARRLLHAASAAGAEALGLRGEAGTMAPGARARLIAVDLPGGSTDPEEALVSGVEASRIRHIVSEPQERGQR